MVILYLKGLHLWKEQLEAFLSSDSTKNGQVCRQFKYELNFTDMFYMNYKAVLALQLTWIIYVQLHIVQRSPVNTVFATLYPTSPTL